VKLFGWSVRLVSGNPAAGGESKAGHVKSQA
jgi:hypothetical protein